MGTIVRYVDDVNGSDSNNGETELTAWKSIIYANSQIANLNPGVDTVEIRVLDASTSKGYRGYLNVTNNGSQQNPIIFTNQVGHAPRFGGAVNPSGQVSAVRLGGDYIQIKNIAVAFPTDEIPNNTGNADKVTNLRVSGNNCLLDNVNVSPQDNWENLLPENTWTGKHINGFVITGSNNTLTGCESTNCTRSGYIIQGYNNTLEFCKSARSRTEIVIFGGNADDSNQGHKVEFCSFEWSGDEDSIQSNNYATTGTTIDFRGLAVRYSILANNLENGSDMKGGHYILFENNVVHSCGFTGFTIGNAAGDAERIVYRNNIIFANLGGIKLRFKDFKAYHNVIWSNYTNQSGLAYTSNIFANTVFSNVQIENFDVSLKNNIIANDGDNTTYLTQGGAAVYIVNDLANIPNPVNADVDKNVYYINPTLRTDGCDFLLGNGGNFERYDLAGWRSRTGLDQNSTEQPINMVNMPTNPSNDQNVIKNYDVGLDHTSPAKNFATHLTTATNSGTNSITLTVTDSKFFFAGWVNGIDDYIRFGSDDSIHKVVAINDATNTLTLESPASWNAGETIWWNVGGSSVSQKDAGVITWQPAGPNQDTIQYTVSGTGTTIPDQSFSINENSPNGTLVGQISYSGAAVTSWSINTTDFTINQNGELFVNTSLDYETQNIYQFIVTGVNTNNDTINANITVNVTNVSESITISDASFTVNSDSPIGTVVGAINPTGENTHVANWTANSSEFSIDNNGIIRVNNTLIPNNTYTFTTTVTNTDNITSTNNISVLAEDTPDAKYGLNNRNLRYSTDTNSSLVYTFTNIPSGNMNVKVSCYFVANQDGGFVTFTVNQGANQLATFSRSQREATSQEIELANFTANLTSEDITIVVDSFDGNRYFYDFDIKLEITDAQ